MNLANPSIGDILDRLSILSIKAQQHSAVTAVSPQVIAEEYQALVVRLVEKLRGTAWPQPEALAKLLVQAGELGACNGRLWELHEQPGDTLLKYAMRLNAQRRKVAEEIG